MLPKSINTSQKIKDVPAFECDGITNYIHTDTISSVRAEEFLKLAPNLSVSMELLDVHSLLRSIFQDLSNVTVLGDVIGVTNKVGNILMKTKDKSAGDITEEQVNLVYELCALFILWPEEDATVIDKAFMQKKINVWKKHVDFMSFFLLARRLSLLFKTRSDADFRTPV